MTDYRFSIDVYTPQSLPLKTLAEYLRDLATLLGSEGDVHFERVEAGSAVAVTSVAPDADPQVRARVEEVRNASGPPEALKAYRRLNDRLRDDNAIGTLSRGPAVVLEFPGRNLARPLKYGPIRRPGRIQGTIIRVGGKDETVPVHVEDAGTVWLCTATRDLARDLGPYIFGKPVRLVGEGRWMRTEDGVWEQSDFKIASWHELDNLSLSDVVAALNDVPGNGWRNIEDARGLLRELRESSGAADS